MTDPVRPPRRYTEKEVGLILRRATELQRAEPSFRDPTGLTLGELEEIAQEAGIDSQMLRRAARDIEAGQGATLGARLLGASPVVSIERVVQEEFPEERLDELVPLIQAATPWQGSAGAIGKTLTWLARSDANTSSQQVLVSVREGETLIRIEERLGGLAGALYGGIMGGGSGVAVGVGATLGGVLGSAALAVALPLAMIAGSYALTRAIFAAQAAKRRRAAETLMDRLIDHVGRESRKELTETVHDAHDSE